MSRLAAVAAVALAALVLLAPRAEAAAPKQASVYYNDGYDQGPMGKRLAALNNQTGEGKPIKSRL